MEEGASRLDGQKDVANRRIAFLLLGVGVGQEDGHGPDPAPPATYETAT